MKRCRVRRLSWRALLLCAGATMTIAATAMGDSKSTDAAPVPRDQFAYTMHLTVSAGVPVHRVVVPLEVYRHTAHADLADLRVLNGAGEIVPYAVRGVSSGSERKQEAIRLPLYPLRGDAARATQALRLTIRTEGAAIDVRGAAQEPGSVPVSGYLLDAREISSSITALTLDWTEGTAGFSAGVLVETSEDLADWHTLLVSAPLVDLRYGADHLVQRRVELVAIHPKFLRLRWNTVPGPVEITGVLADRATSHVETAREELAIPGTASRTQAGEYVFDLDAHPPVDRFNLRLPQLNTVAQVEVLTRADDRRDRADAQKSENPWYSLWQGTVYRLQAQNGENGEISNPLIDIPTTSRRQWMVRVRSDGGGLGTGVPQLIVRWLPAEVLFVARGEEPFELVYGNVSAGSAATALDLVLPRGAEPQTGIRIADARPGSAVTLGGPDRLAPQPESLPWRKIFLWSVLLAAVAVLGLMAARLARQMPAPGNEPASQKDAGQP